MHNYGECKYQSASQNKLNMCYKTVTMRISCMQPLNAVELLQQANKEAASHKCQ